MALSTLHLTGGLWTVCLHLPKVNDIIDGDSKLEIHQPFSKVSILKQKPYGLPSIKIIMKNRKKQFWEIASVVGLKRAARNTQGN